MSDFILARVSQTLATEQSFETLVRQLLEMLELVTNMESTYLTRIDKDQSLQHIVFSRNTDSLEIPEGFSLPWDATLCKLALEEDCYFSNEVNTRWSSCKAAQALGITTFLTTPVHLADGSLYGTLCASSRDNHSLSVNSRYVLQLFAGLIARYVEKESLVSQLREANAALLAHSYTDELTGLPNRRAIYEQLEDLFHQARLCRQQVLVAFIDLDDFKTINDKFGHPEGDSFLIQVGQRLSEMCGEHDIIGRLGGDEFLIATLVTSPDERSEFSERLRRQIRGHYWLGETEIDYPGASIGVISASPDTLDAQNALRAADDAMYLDKKNRLRTRANFPQ